MIVRLRDLVWFLRLAVRVDPRLCASWLAASIIAGAGPARLADRILVLHDELTTREGGRYRTMFLSQAAWYREEIAT